MDRAGEVATEARGTMGQVKFGVPALRRSQQNRAAFKGLRNPNTLTLSSVDEFWYGLGALMRTPREDGTVIHEMTHVSKRLLARTVGY